MTSPLRRQPAATRRSASLTASADEIAPSAGLTEVDGPAVVVTLDDAKQGSAQLPDGVTPDDLVVHQQDVQAVVNALWRRGRSNDDPGSTGHRDLGGAVRRQHAHPAGAGLLAALRHQGDGQDRCAQGGPRCRPKIEIYRQYVDAIGLGYDVKVITKTRFPAFTGAIGLSQAVVAR